MIGAKSLSKRQKRKIKSQFLGKCFDSNIIMDLIQKINSIYKSIGQVTTQISKNTLFGSEEFSVGGYYSVRGFKENFITGDHGYYLRNKVNFNLGDLLNPLISTKTNNNFISKNSYHISKINIEPFYDYGYVKKKYNNENGRLSSIGFKTSFLGKYFDASFTYSKSLQKSNLITNPQKENKIFYFELAAKL